VTEAEKKKNTARVLHILVRMMHHASCMPEAKLGENNWRYMAMQARDAVVILRPNLAGLNSHEICDVLCKEMTGEV